MKTKTNELTGAALDWAVAKCEGVPYTYQHTASGEYGRDSVTQRKRCYSTHWALGGPIIEREGISWHCGNKTSWHAYGYGSDINFSGPTPLIAAMRCYVASKLGDEVDVPQELL